MPDHQWISAAIEVLKCFCVFLLAVLLPSMAPKQSVIKDTEKKARGKAKSAPSSDQLDVKKEQQNFLNTLKYRANQCNSTEAQELLKAPGFEKHKQLKDGITKF